jgi:hypothetical protein
MRRGTGALRLLAATAGTAIIVAACSAPSASVEPSTGPPAALPTEATLAPSQTPAAALPSPSPSVVPSPSHGVGTLDVMPPGAAVQVIVSELNLRRKPSTSAKRLEILKRGQLLVVSPSDNISLGWGPVNANGYTWYPVIKIDSHESPGTLDPLPMYPIPLGAEPISGWVASDNGSRPYLAMVPPRCPTTIDLVNVEGMLPAERLACFGEPITLTGTLGCPGCGGATAGIYKPVWLATPLEFDFLSVNPAEHAGPLAVRFPPGGPERPPAGSRVTVTVHIDDPRSTKCQMVDGEGADAVTVDQRTAILYCRERLVVESVQNLGPDPSFPTY